jgi:hypothetical protein
MGLSVFPAAAGGGIKLVQRGVAVASGDVTITAVDTAKAFVNIFGTASSGTVSASFGLNAGNVALKGVGSIVTALTNLPQRPTGATIAAASADAASTNQANLAWTWTQAVNSGTTNAGSNNLVSAVVQGFLADSTTLTVSGACRWEVVEFA